MLVRWTADHPGNIFGKRVFAGHVRLVRACDRKHLRDQPVEMLPKYDEDGEPILYNF